MQFAETELFISPDRACWKPLGMLTDALRCVNLTADRRVRETEMLSNLCADPITVLPPVARGTYKSESSDFAPVQKGLH